MYLVYNSKTMSLAFGSSNDPVFSNLVDGFKSWSVPLALPTSLASMLSSGGGCCSTRALLFDHRKAVRCGLFTDLETIGPKRQHIPVDIKYLGEMNRAMLLNYIINKYAHKILIKTTCLKKKNYFHRVAGDYFFSLPINKSYILPILSATRTIFTIAPICYTQILLVTLKCKKKFKFAKKLLSVALYMGSFIKLHSSPSNYNRIYLYWQLSLFVHIYNNI